MARPERTGGKTLSFFRLVVALGLCFAAGAIGSLVTTPQLATWYAGLAKPSWTPPNVVFPIAWTTLYVLMAVALWRLWDRHPPSPERRRALALFAVQLALNVLWSVVFFAMEAPGSAFVVIIALWLAIAATIAAARPFERVAALLLAPYLIWVSYAAVLNAVIVLLNS